MIKEVIINESEVEKFVKKIINSAKTQPVNVENALYHHNTKYEYAPFNIRNGLMSVMMLQKYGRVNYTEEQLSAFENDCYNVNGIYCISLSKVGLDDKYREDEDEYDPLTGMYPDFLISSEVFARRKYKNYFNEFVADDIILPEHFKAIDTRLIRICNDEEKRFRFNSREEKLRILKENYNQLSEIAKAMKETGLNIPLREMSYEDNMALDIDKVSKFPKISLIKK